MPTNVRISQIRPSFKRTGHIALFGLRDFACRGENLSRGFPFKEASAYTQALRSKLCPKCLAVFDGIAATIHDELLPAHTAARTDRG